MTGHRDQMHGGTGQCLLELGTRFKGSRQGDAGEVCIVSTVGKHLLDVLGPSGPKAHIVPIPGQHDRQGGPPGTRPDHGD